VIRIAFLLGFLAAIGCASSPAPAPPATPPAQVPLVSSDGSDLLNPIERLAFLIHAQDIAAWRATDQAFESGFDPAASGVVGWIAVPEQGTSFMVRFVAERASGPVSLLDVGLDVALESPGLVIDRPGGAALSPIEQAMWKARQLAVHAKYRACSDRYNSVVLREPDSENWLVYLLAASMKGDLVIGGHHRFRVSPDGGTILEAKALSMSCMTMPYDEKAAAFYFTQVVSEEPLETSVLLSLQVDKPIVFMVPPDGAVWMATRGHLTKVRDRP
jgi:hypothetical protein